MVPLAEFAAVKVVLVQYVPAVDTLTAVGKALTVTLVAADVQPLLSVYVMVGEPAATPVTVPDETVANAVLEDDHALLAAAVPEPVNAVVEPIQTLAVPLIVGKAFTVNKPDTFDVTDEHGLVPVTTQ